MLTIAPLKRWSINYYNETARTAGQAAKDAARANGGLGEYYSERDTRAPVWMCAGDKVKAAELAGLSDADRAGGQANPDLVERWLDDGVAPNGACGRRFTERDNHGFDLTFCAPKSVSLLRAFGDDVTQKAVEESHTGAVADALEYIHAHAGYTRVHNAVTGTKDLVWLPGLITAAYQHETSRAGDPHLHTHVIVPNKQPRADGKLVAVDSDSFWHEAKAGGTVYQASLRRRLHRALAKEWGKTDPHTGMAELAGAAPAMLRAWSQRSTALREWAADNLVLADDKASAAQLAAAQKATRPRKPEGMAWAELRRLWHEDPRGFSLDPAAEQAAKRQRLDELQRLGLDARRHARSAAAMAAGIDKPAFTRADLVELVGAQLPVDTPDDPRSVVEQIEALVDAVAMRVTEPRQAHHREGHERYTIDRVLAEEITTLDMLDRRDERAVIPAPLIDTTSLSADQAKAVTNMATSPWLIQPLQAPAGAGKTHSLKALRDAAHRVGKHIIVVTPTGKAVDVAMRKNAGDDGHTVDRALLKLRNNTLPLDSRTVVIVDEAGMLGTPKMRELLDATTGAGAKTLLVGDPHQLAPVKARGGMFEQMCTDAPWAQQLTEVWRLRDPQEKAASLALRHGGPKPMRRATAAPNRCAAPSPGTATTTGCTPATTSPWPPTRWRATAPTARPEKTRCSSARPTKWPTPSTGACTTNTSTPTHPPSPQTAATASPSATPSSPAAATTPSPPNSSTNTAAPPGRADPVRNGNRWTVTAIDVARGMIAARRHGDGARAAFGADYYREHITHGYATTVHPQQGADAETCHLVAANTTNAQLLYTGMTRGSERNTVYLYQRLAGEGDHEHADPPGVHVTRRGTPNDAAHLLRQAMSRRDDQRPRTVHDVAAGTDRDQLPERIASLLDRHDRALTHRRAEHRKWFEANHTRDGLTAEQRHWLDQQIARQRDDQARNHHRGRGRGSGISL